MLLHVLKNWSTVLFYKSCIVPGCHIPLLENKTKFVFGQKGLSLLMFNMFEGIKGIYFRCVVFAADTDITARFDTSCQFVRVIFDLYKCKLFDIQSNQ